MIGSRLINNRVGGERQDTKRDLASYILSICAHTQIADHIDASAIRP